MDGIIFRISGRWAQFRKPETNNNPLTHDFITKTALMGLIGAVLGIERAEMKALFPQLCEDLVYGVRLNRAIKKESWAFTMRNVNAPNNPAEKSPRQMEFLRDPNFTVALVLLHERSAAIFTRFRKALKSGEACYTPVLGLHNCPAELEWLDDGEFVQSNGVYRARGFVLRSHRLSAEFDFARFQLGFERVPTHQDNNWWNRPDNYREVVYPSAGSEVVVTGEHYRFGTGEAWCLI